jgi:hypothetical protein
MAKLNSLAARRQHLRGLAEAAREVAREERQLKIEWGRDPIAETDIVLQKMLAVGAKLDLATYIHFAYLYDPPEGIEEDGEFLASVPDCILKGTTKVQ